MCVCVCACARGDDFECSGIRIRERVCVRMCMVQVSLAPTVRKLSERGREPLGDALHQAIARGDSFPFIQDLANGQSQVLDIRTAACVCVRCRSLNIEFRPIAKSSQGARYGNARGAHCVDFCQLSFFRVDGPPPTVVTDGCCRRLFPAFAASSR